MEKALKISRVADLGSWNNEFSRVYFGDEFCDRLIPSGEDLGKVLSFAAEKSLGFSLLTTFCTEENLRSYRKIFDLLYHIRPDAEIVINDWGLFKVIKEYSFAPVLGRLLNKQKRGPRIMNVINNLSGPMRKRFKESGVNAYFSAFLSGRGIRRVELDNLLQGLSLDEFRGRGIGCSLHVPFGYISVSRSCPHSRNRGSPVNKPAGGNCRRECLENRYWLRNPQMPVPLLLRGNAVFFENKIVNESALREAGIIDRIVYEANV